MLSLLDEITLQNWQTVLTNNALLKKVRMQRQQNKETFVSIPESNEEPLTP